MVLRDVRYAADADGCRERVTFVFDSPSPDAPGYRVEYQPGPFTQDASGEPVPVAGAAFVVVRLEPAWGYDFERNEPSYTGPRRIPGSGLVTEIVETGDFEAVMSWVIGLETSQPFEVEAEGAPDHQLTVTITRG
jgi:hypothetical protein